MVTGTAQVRILATQTRGSAPEKRDRPSRPTRAARTTPAVFLRQIVAELRKVIWPTRQELITYTTVCIVFVAVVMAYVAGLDIAFGKLVLLVFGGRGA